jgi:hypothetical protein
MWPPLWPSGHGGAADLGSRQQEGSVSLFCGLRSPSLGFLFVGGAHVVVEAPCNNVSPASTPS